MRGKVAVQCDAVDHGGITPAYAGKRRTADSERGNGKDHPRLCGEKCLFYTRPQLIPGSPPPMRGKD